MAPAAALVTAASIWGLASGHAFIPTAAPLLPCDYAVDSAPAVAVTGNVPKYLNGTMYHAMFGARIPILQGGVVSVSFAPKITGSFGYSNGPLCKLQGESKSEWWPPFKDTFNQTDSVTVSADPRSDSRVFTVSAMPEMSALDSRSLKVIENPVQFEGDDLGSDWQNWPARVPVMKDATPRFWGPAHAPTDANGDLYGLVYIFKPKPAYRVWKLEKATGRRKVFPDVPAADQFQALAKPGPAYAHQCLHFTERFMIIPEIPLRMSLPPFFNFWTIQDNWMADGAIVFTILEKATGKLLGRYKAPAAYSWHSINAFEEDGQIHLDMTWQQNYTALDVFTGRRHGMLWWYYQGKYARFTMPIPKMDGSQAGDAPGTAAVTDLTKVGKPFVSPDFGIVNPRKMWRQRARYIWGLATSDDHKDEMWFPHVIKVDTAKPAETPMSYDIPEGTTVGSPIFVPSDEAGAAEDEGVLTMLLYNTSDTMHTYVLVLDATTLKERAMITLPIRQATNIGLHNHYSEYPTEAMTVTV